MIPPINFTIPSDQQGGEITQPNGEPAGRATYDPPAYPDAPSSVTCALPCVGMGFSLPIPNHELWVCSWQRITTTRTHGRNGGEYSSWLPGYVISIETSEQFLTLPLTLYLPGDVSRGSHFWNINSLREIPYIGTGIPAPVLTTGYFYKDSIGTDLTPCHAQPFITYEEWIDRWNAIYAAWAEHTGEDAWQENYFFEWLFSEINESIPQTGNMIPIYAGSVGIMSALIGGTNGSGGVMGLASMAFVLAILQAASSASASAGGRVLKSAEGEEAFEGMW